MEPEASFKASSALGNRDGNGVSPGPLRSVRGLGVTYSRNSHQPHLTCTWLGSLPPWKPSRISIISFPEALFGWGFLEGILQAGIIKERHTLPVG